MAASTPPRDDEVTAADEQEEREKAAAADEQASDREPPDERDGHDELSHEEIAWTPNAKLKRISEVDVSAFPASYRSNSKKEGLVLEYVANFERQYVDLYPRRAPLLLCPLNECGMPKFICTTVRPTQLPFKPLYDYEQCAAFVADYVRYEPLELPTSLPRHMPSPTSVLRWQAGDCFDMSILLCSLLLGVGYDAYVVVGYAHGKVTACDQTDKPPHNGLGARLAEAGGGAGGNKYAVARRPPLESKFLKEQGAESEAESASARTRAAREVRLATGTDPDEAEEMDELRGKRVHAWVLLLAGKRELPDNFYVEPSTGACQRIDDGPPYYGVEAIFNAANYWVNMQPRARPAKALSWELQDTSCWEYVLIDSIGGGAFDAMAGAEDGDGGDEARADAADARPPTPPLVPPADAGAPAAAGVEPGAPDGGAADAPADRGAAAPRSAGACMPSAALAAPAAPAVGAVGGGEAEGDEVSGAVGPDNVLDLPPSWVERISLTAAQFESRCPGRSKEAIFERGTLLKWAPYARNDGLVARLTLYSDTARTQTREVHETFEQRKDKLHRRVTKVDANQVIEEFLPGRPFGLKEHELESGVRRRMRFFPSARLDGLQLREEMMGRKTIEAYTGRDDRLVYRSVSFDEASAAAVAAGSKETEPTIAKMTEKYSRQPHVDAEHDVAKRVYDVLHGQICVFYHHGPGRITASSRIYHKESWPPSVTLVDPFAKQPADSALREDYAHLVAAERECLQAFRDQERQMKDILNRRRAEEDEVQLLFSVYDTARSRHYLDADRKEDAAAAAAMHDYLTPFLPNAKSTEPLERDAALKVREACLKSLRDRLVERATIIQSRLDEENANLAKRTSTFSRNRDHADKQTEEEYERYCQAAMFRIQIIDERLKRHEKQALQKYEEMDSRLRADPRMRALLHA